MRKTIAAHTIWSHSAILQTTFVPGPRTASPTQCDPRIEVAALPTIVRRLEFPHCCQISGSFSWIRA